MDILERLRTGLSARYRIDEEVGLGGMARVYRAEDLKHGRRVAVKVLRPEVALGLGPDRFRREIDIAAGLNHPNILGLHDSGEVDGLLYFVMPYVDGESLRTRIDREGALPLDECVRIAQEIGEALQYAHDRGLVHRDVKPENILFLEGHALVCDFGIAKATQGAQEHLTHTGMAVGTLSYMSPEQMSDGAEVDGRADLYALGCLVHEMLSGRAPFSASTPGATLAKKLAGAASALDSRDASIPGTVRRVVSRALAPDLTERFSTMREFTSSLAHAATALAVEEDTRRRRKARALRWGTLLAGAVVIGAAGLRLARYISRPAIQRIAVLPLETALADPSQDFFAQGVHQDLVLEMARFGLRVINSASVARYAGVDQRIRLIAEELDVDGILSGSAALADDNVTITMVLVGGESEEVLWAASFSSHIRNVLELYRDITLAVAERIGVPLSADAETLLADPPTVDPQVFEALLQARFHTRRLTEEGLATALEYYELVLDRDPRSAEAWFGVAQVWAFRAQQGLVSAEEATRQGDEAMAKVAEFDPGFSRDPAGLALRRTWVEWNWSEGETAFREALSRDPTDAVTRAYYSVFLLYLGRRDEAVTESDRATETDPFNALVHGLRSQVLNALGRYSESEATLLKTLDRTPDDPMAVSMLRTTYHLMGREDEALEMWRTRYRVLGDEELLEALDRGARQGGYASGLRWVAEAMVKRSDTQHVTPWQIATAYTRAGMEEQALDYLELAYEARDPNVPYISIDPIFDPFRNRPRFQALLHNLGLPD